MRDLAIVVPFYNGHAFIENLLRTLPSEFAGSVPVVIVDDCSDNGEVLDATHLRTIYRNTEVLSLTKKRYFSGAVNAGIDRLTFAKRLTHDILVLNQDVFFTSSAWVKQIEDARAQGYALVGERIKGNHPAFPHGYVHGTFMFMNQAAIEEVGVLNEVDFPLWGATAEWQWRVARRGWKVLPLVEVEGFVHERGAGKQFGTSITQLLNTEPVTRRTLFVRTPPLVSVIVPCYNYGRFLSDAIASLIGGKTVLGDMPGQTMQGFEIIIVDDSSTDETPQIGQALADDWKGIFYHRTTTRVGTAAAYNAGVKMSRGRYVTILSADDMREPQSLENLYRAQVANPNSFVYDDITIVTDGKRRRLWKMEDYDFDKLLFKNHVHAGIMFPRVAWDTVGGYPEIMNDGREDWAMNIALGQAGFCGVHVAGFGYLYRRDGQNRSLTNTSPKDREYFLGKLNSLFPALYQGERPMACCGGGRKTNNNAPAGTPAAQIMMPGSAGMTQVMYTGSQIGTSTYVGFVTKTPYRFGANRRISWVDNRDVGERGVSGLFNIKQNGRFAFTLANQPPQPVSVPEPVNDVEELPFTDLPEQPEQVEEEPVALVLPAPEPELVAEAVVEPVKPRRGRPRKVAN